MGSRDGQEPGRPGVVRTNDLAASRLCPPTRALPTAALWRPQQSRLPPLSLGSQTALQGRRCIGPLGGSRSDSGAARCVRWGARHHLRLRRLCPTTATGISITGRASGAPRESSGVASMLGAAASRPHRRARLRCSHPHQLWRPTLPGRRGHPRPSRGSRPVPGRHRSHRPGRLPGPPSLCRGHRRHRQPSRACHWRSGRHWRLRSGRRP
mmetsp:Transcript_25266/g.69470  ORF Transcript_25266/g.69470 Transcript_25266/m.69470 type:complete len:210 (-) Transcript_25266:863-1492(-)